MVGISELRKEPHWSFSSLNTYLNICSLKYAFEYVYGAEHERTSASLPFGRAFHAAMSGFAASTASEQTERTDAVQEAFAEWLKMECAAAENLFFKPGESIDFLMVQGFKMLAASIENWNANERVLSVARAFKINVPNISKPLIGEMDCVVREPCGTDVIVDWKTSCSRWPRNKANKDMQATVFSYAYLVEEGVVPVFRYDVITKAKEPAFESHRTQRTRDDMQRLQKVISGVEKAVNAEVFLPAETSFSCGECAFAGSCRKWHRQSTKKSVGMTGR